MKKKGQTMKTTTKEKIELTKYQRDLMKAVRNGADISGYTDAMELRRMEKLGWVTVCECMGEYDGAGRLPYFGAILSPEGRKIERAAQKSRAGGGV